MGQRSLSIAADVFSSFPHYTRGVVIAYGLSNGPSSPGLVARLREAEASVHERMDLATITAHPRISAWREAFKAQGIKPNEFRCSVEAMARRALRNQPLPSINALVDIGNMLSLTHLVPMGSHAIDVVVGDLLLHTASGNESFVPFGSDTSEHPNPGEIIFAEGDTVLTRRWSWRQANHTLTLPGTTAVEFNVDGLPPVMPTEIEKICAELTALIQEYCGGASRVELVTQDHPSISIER